MLSVSHPQALTFQFPDSQLPISAFLCLRDYLGSDICPIPAPQIAGSECWNPISSQSDTEENWYINAPAPSPWRGTILSVCFALTSRVPQNYQALVIHTGNLLDNIFFIGSLPLPVSLHPCHPAPGRLPNKPWH